MDLQKELQYFKDNQKKLLRQYNGKILVIKKQSVVGVYETEIEAYKDAETKFGLGTFIIQKCLPGEEIYTQTFFSRYAPA